MKTTTKKATKTRTTPYDVAEHLRTPEEMAAYLDAWFKEASDDATGIARALVMVQFETLDVTLERTN